MAAASLNNGGRGRRDRRVGANAALEVREEDAERAAALLEQAMTLAFEEIFPGAPLTGLVSARTGRSWEETK